MEREWEREKAEMTGFTVQSEVGGEQGRWGEDCS